MAGTISINLSRVAENGSFKETLAPGSISIVQTSEGAYSDIVSCSTVVTEITFGSVSSYGRLYLRNMHGTSAVSLFASTSGSTVMMPFAQVQPGEPNDFRSYPAMRLWSQITDSTTANLFVSMLAN